MKTCTEIQPDLVGYHFGEVEPATRDAIEAHLLGCRSCLTDFLALKREIETAESDAAPSPKARLELRRAVAQQVRPRRPWSWWERPLALLCAGAAVAAALFVLQIVASSPGAPPRSLRVDSAAPTQLR